MFRKQLKALAHHQQIRPLQSKKDATSMQMRPCLKVLSGGPLRSQLFTIYPLRTYPDRDFVNELLQDINFGVRIGFNHDRTP